MNSIRSILKKHPYSFYLATSIAYGIVVTLLALVTWSDFFNSKPARGDMGFGRFVIRGSRFVNGKYTPFAYPWRTLSPSTLGRYIGWFVYAIHQTGQWYILARVQMSKEAKWSQDYQWWNWYMVYLNGSMLIIKLVHGHVFYDGLAIDVPEGIAQASVIIILVIAIIMAIPYRGIIFGRGKKPRSESVIQFIRKYHGYVMSFGTVGNFHYHPVEGTMGHCFGFIYQCLLIWQSTTFLHKTHANKSWVLLLETWVFLHGTLTAIIQPGTGWQIFSYGFMIMFLVNQIFQTRASQNKTLMGLVYVLFCAWAYWGLNKEKVYYRATFIPIAEYACVYVALFIGKMTCLIADRLRCYKKLFVISVYVCVTVLLTIGLAMILAGNIKIYNDY